MTSLADFLKRLSSKTYKVTQYTKFEASSCNHKKILVDEHLKVPALMIEISDVRAMWGLVPFVATVLKGRFFISFTVGFLLFLAPAGPIP